MLSLLDLFGLDAVITSDSIGVSKSSLSLVGLSKYYGTYLLAGLFYTLLRSYQGNLRDSQSNRLVTDNGTQILAYNNNDPSDSLQIHSYGSINSGNSYHVIRLDVNPKPSQTGYLSIINSTATIDIIGMDTTASQRQLFTVLGLLIYAQTNNHDILIDVYDTTFFVYIPIPNILLDPDEVVNA